MKWWEVEPSSCDSCVLQLDGTLQLGRVLPDVLTALKPGANVVGIATLESEWAYAELVAAIEDANFDIRDCALVVTPSEQIGVLFARKPLEGTVAQNVLKHGVGGLNIDASRIRYESGEVDFDRVQRQQHSEGAVEGAFGAASLIGTEIPTYNSEGRWPANLMFQHSEWCQTNGTTAELIGGGKAGTSGFAAGYERGDGFEGRVVESPTWNCEADCPVGELDKQSGVSKSSAAPRRNAASDSIGTFKTADRVTSGHSDEGGASRYFYCYPGCPVDELDKQSGVSKSTGGRIGKKDESVVGNAPAGQYQAGDPGFGDVGGASRYFYCYSDCPVSILDEQSGIRASGNFPANNRTGFGKGLREDSDRTGLSQERVPTDAGGASRYFYAAKSVMPLLTYLCRLVTPEGGAILDPSNNPYTRIAAESAGFEFVGITR